MAKIQWAQWMIEDTKGHCENIEEGPPSPHGMVAEQFLEEEHLIDVLK